MIMEAEFPAGEQYVHRIDELRAEIGHAMAAISENSLSRLEESLWRQEVLCTGLKHLVRQMGEHTVETPFSIRLRASVAALHQVNQSYVELLRQAKASNRLMQALCRQHGRAPDEQTAPFAQRCSVEA